MAKEMQNLTGLISGTFKIIEPTDKRNSSNRVIWKAECICGEYIYCAKPELEKYAGHSECTGHPAAPKPIEGFHLHPDNKETPEHIAAVAAWELKRNPEQPATETDKPLSQETDVCQDNTEQAEVVATDSVTITESSPEPQTADAATATIPKESKVLRERLGLSGYITETVKLPETLEILGCKAEGVVFAKQIAGADRVLLHVTLVDAAGKHSIVSSRKKVPLPEWQAISESLTGMSIKWRDKELKRAAK